MMDHEGTLMMGISCHRDIGAERQKGSVSDDFGELPALPHCGLLLQERINRRVFQLLLHAAEPHP